MNTHFYCFDALRRWNERDFTPFFKPAVIADALETHTWKDASLRELTRLVQSIEPKAKDNMLEFSHVYCDKDGRSRLRKIGRVHGGGKEGDDSNKTLHDIGFETGDYICISVLSS